MFKDSVINVAGRLVAIFSTFLSVFLLGRLFSVEEFGLWTWLFSIFGLINAQDFGFIAAMRVKLGRAFAASDAEGQRLWFAAGLLLTLITISGIFLSYLAFGKYLGNSSDGNGRYYATLLVVFCSLFTVLGMCFCHALMAFLESAWVGFAEGLRALFQVMSIYVAYELKLDFGAALCLFYVVTALYTPFVAWVFMRQRAWQFCQLWAVLINRCSEIKASNIVLLREGWPLWLSQLGLALLAISDVFLAGLFLPEDEVAYVNVIARLVLLGVGIVGASLIPATGYFVSSLKSWDRGLVVRRVGLTILCFSALGFSYSLFLWFFGSDLVRWWSTLEIDLAAPFLMAGVLFAAMTSVALMQVFIQFSSYCRAILPWLFASILCKVGFTALLVSWFGYAGVFYASFIANTLFLAANFYMLFVSNHFAVLTMNCGRSAD